MKRRKLAGWVSLLAPWFGGCGGGDLQPREVSLTDEERALAETLGWRASDLAVIKSFGRADVGRLTALSDEGYDVAAEGVVIEVADRDRRAAMSAIGDRLGPAGLRAYTRHRGFGMSPDQVAVIRSDDPFTIVEIARTDGINYGVTHEALLARLRDWDRRFGVEVLGASLDWVEIRLEAIPEDPRAFARELYELCPDSVDQGAGSLEALADEVAKGELFLWWD